MPHAVTEIVINGITIPNAASRFPTAEVSYIDNGELAYDCNGVLHDCTLESHRKRQITVSCDDIRAPEMVNIWRGTPVTITLMKHLLGAANVTVDCMVVDYAPSRDEGQAKTSWSLILWER